MARIQAAMALIALAQLLGCANVKVHKVSVEDRAAGADRHVKGFRYYLNRPYIVVSERVPVSTQYVPAVLTRANGAPQGATPFLMTLLPDSNGEHRVYNLEGQRIPEADWRCLRVLKETAKVEAIKNTAGSVVISKDAAATIETPKAESADATAAIQVAFLPDFEEQYVIRNKNFLAKTKYQYDFRNGMQLAGFAGSYNATDVPVKILETVGNLVTAAGKVAETALGQPIPGVGIEKFTVGDDGRVTRDPFFIKIERAIEPGFYQVQKSWERARATPEMPLDEVCGLFSSVGLDLVETTSVLTREQYEKETGRTAAESSAR